MRTLRPGRVLPLALAACAGALAFTPARADEIHLKSGRAISDVEVTDESYETVTYKILGSQQDEPASNVVEVVYTRRPVGFAEAEKEFQTGQFARAIGDLTKFKDAREKSARQYALFYLGEAKRQTGDLAGAQEAYEKLLEDFPKSRFFPRAKVGMGLIRIEQKDFSGAQKAFEELIADARKLKLGDDVTAEANLRLAGLLEMQGKLKEAQDRYERVAASAPAESHGGQMAQVAALRIKGTLSPSSADGAISQLQGIFDGADPANLKAGAKPDFELLAACANALGEVRAAKGDPQKALLDFLRVVFDPDLSLVTSEQPRALFGAAAAFEKAKSDDWKARAEWCRSVLRSTYPNSPFAKKLGG